MGHGDVDIYTMIDGETFTIHLHDVLYVPGNWNNLFSLRRWLAKGGDFSGQDLALVSKMGKLITKGTLTPNNLIKLHFHYTKSDTKNANPYKAKTSNLTGQQRLKPWNVWHHRFGHISYSSLRKLFDRKLVTGFNVDHDTLFTDCAACTEAKQLVIPFNKGMEHESEPGELTHVNVWGKYSVSSINSFQYYLLMVDDASHYVTVEFLKSKDQAVQKLKNYFTHLKVQGETPKAMCINRRHEFVNDLLLDWLYLKGMEVHMTAPYSPSQNGVTERMN